MKLNGFNDPGKQMECPMEPHLLWMPCRTGLNLGWRAARHGESAKRWSTTFTDRWEASEVASVRCLVGSVVETTSDGVDMQRDGVVEGRGAAFFWKSIKRGW